MKGYHYTYPHAFPWDVYRWMTRGFDDATHWWVWPSHVAREFGCTKFEASLALLFLREAGAVIQANKGRWYVRRCSICGCTLHRACKGGCSWVGPSTCSACEMKNKGASNGTVSKQV